MRARALLLLVLVSACLPRSVRRAQKQEGRYSLGAPTGEGWRVVDPGGADYAWWNPSLQGAIYADSNCGSRYADSRLAYLAEHLRNGLRESEVLEQRPLTLDSREALYAVWAGDLDGVAVRIAAVVLNKDSCTYDLVYLAPPATHDKGLDAFTAVYQDFHAQGAQR